LSSELTELQKPVVAVQRSVKILRYLARSQRPAGIREIARAIDVIPSTCMYILRTLESDGMVTLDAKSNNYSLGGALLYLAQGMVSNNEFIKAAQPMLDQIADENNVTAVAAWLESSDRMTVVAKSNVSSNFTVNITLGSRFPAFMSATGICCAAESKLSDEQFQKKFEKLVWKNPPDFRTWLGDIAFTRENGYSVDHGRVINGVTQIAVPVFDGEATATRFLAILDFSQDLANERRQKLISLLKNAAQDLSGEYSGVA